MTSESLKWYVLGLIACSGSFSGDKKPRLTIKKREDLDVLQACVDLLGGRINGPYTYRGSHGSESRYHVWALDGAALTAAIPTLDGLPEGAKRDQYLSWKARYNL